MRTTLELEDDVMHAAKQLARQGLESRNPPRERNGVPLFIPKPGAAKPDMTLVNRLRDEE